MTLRNESPIRPTIVLASYRGAQHIAEQIESIRAQTHRSWSLVIRDDGSDDGTRAIIDREAARDGRIEVLEDGRGRLGVIENFSSALDQARGRGGDWFALCDQDDIWLPDKLERQIERAVDGPSDPSLPRLIHSDLAVVDADLRPIASSLHALMGIQHESDEPLGVLLIQNFVTGCSCLLNRALLDVALPVPKDSVMVDWWLALCAAATGRIEFEPGPTVLYRQHPANVLGARPLRDAIGATLARTFSLRRHDPTEFRNTLGQALALERRLSERSTDSSERIEIARSAAFVTEYLDLFRSSPGRLRRVCALRRRGVRRQNRFLDATLALRLAFVDVGLPDPTRAERDEPEDHDEKLA